MNVSLQKDFECLIEEQKILGKSPQGKEFADFERWLKEFPENSKIINLWKRESLNFLDRDMVRELSHRSITKGNLKEAFLIVMVWGYSGDARGPARVRLIMEQLNFLSSLERTIELLANKKIAEAYECLVVSGPKHLSTSFGSKLLYFFSTPDDEIQPLIFDRRIFLVLDKLGLSVGKSAVLTSKQYMDYLNLASEMAQKYSIPISQVEEHLFIFSGLVSGNYSWKRMFSFQMMSEDQKNKLALHLANTFSSYLENPQVLINGNGGGQYGGYVATGTLLGIKYELHAMTNKRVNLIEPELVRIDWDLVLLRGIARTVRDLLVVTN